MYIAIKHLHMLTAVISIVGFIIRGIGMINDAGWMKHKLVKILPHVNDTILLCSAAYLAISIQQYPFTTDWLTAKVIGLLVYIGLGLVALRFGKSKPVRIAAWLLAIATFVYIAGVARTHLPLFFL
ncbi:MAG: regulator SirB [Gammaproteobacteria bacterium]|nr:MAG: regulator SirB [Gammaproteobacteria bacterium]